MKRINVYIGGNANIIGKKTVYFRIDSSSSDGTNQPRKGRLSSRMLIPGNTWQTVWSTAKPVPARRQVFLCFESLVNSFLIM